MFPIQMGSYWVYRGIPPLGRAIGSHVEVPALDPIQISHGDPTEFQEEATSDDGFLLRDNSLCYNML